MDKQRFKQSEDHLFPLTDDEKVELGWDRDQVVFSAWGPDGMRSIPTRDAYPWGTFYGVIETAEPPSGVSDEDWAAILQPNQEPRRGATS